MSNSNVEMKKNIDDFYKENLSKINKVNVKLILISFLVIIPMSFIKYGMQTKTYIGVAWLILCAGIIMCINKIVKQNEKKAYSILLAGGISAAIYSFLVGGSSNAYVVVLVIVFISAMYFSVKITLISTVPMVAISVILSIIAPYTVEGPGGETIAALSKVAVMGVCIYLIKDAIATGARINKSSFEGMIKLQEENEKTAEIVKELNNVVEESNNIVNDLVKQSASIDDVSKKIIEDATVITNGVSNVNLSVRTVRENIDKDSELSGEVNEKYIEMVNVVNDGVLRVNDTKEIMAVMEKAIRDAYVVTDDLKENMVEIDAILDEIDDIFSQTKLLALNASIEAARAGEKGKGFEVVADEIRGLSDESTTASRNIKQIISVLNDTVDEVATKIKYGSVVSSKGYEEMDSITNILQGINETSKIVEGAIEKEHELIENIAKEFIKVANEMESVSALSEENISMLEDIENNIDKENQSINDLEGKMEYVESIAKTLE